MKNRYEYHEPGFFVGLRGMADQAIKKITIQFVRGGAPPTKPEVVVYGEYEEDQLYRRLSELTTRVTAAMSECKWDQSLLDSSNQMDTALLGFTTQLQKIRKQKGEGVALKMLDATLDKIGKTDFFRTLPDADIIKPQWEETLRTHADIALHGLKQAHSNISLRK